ncbi:hypothetical protein MCOR02_007848 [Pyricularia oryzae]|uniref:Uncharacterized protein n=2 Tax=Pyricularia TaxID=48558 RepID=A0ABQ8NG13_PYRGI|nr:hypothetical protein MCOR01_003888 [Pyricularia oryzae]KAI6296023.1 hypothetical protein MCOR33_007221 [Pyricularia grisea]KAH9430513.1 hypothetical protein MCOR02_007848 [Pyricularia oryzae]KAI6253158.1 hypothetical protein MCOR19_010275 [Pyricularia oryzae]KAI6265702.1 hypothetical protein MCOR26_010601 [Pyricularia oryzae]
MRIARKWELGDKAFSRTATTSFAWKDERRWWLVRLTTDEFVVLANGALCYHKVPDIERLDDGQDA